MSIELMARVWRESKAEGTALLLLLAIADHANQDREAWPGIAHLAKKTRLSERQVQRLIREVESTGELKVENQAGRHGANLYTVFPDRGVTSMSPGGDIQGTKGVTPMSPEPSYNHQSTVNSAAKGAASISTVEKDEWAGINFQLVVVPPASKRSLRDTYTEKCDQCGEPLTQSLDTCPSCRRPVKWEGSALADARAKKAKSRQQDERAKHKREQATYLSTTTSMVLAIARATAPVNALCDYAEGEEEALYQYERAYGAELVKSKLNEFKASGEKGRGLIKHLLAYLTQHNPDKQNRPGKGGGQITTDPEAFGREEGY